MRKCIIHFGMHKTGSSSIQDTLYRERSVPGFYYINLGMANQTQPLLIAFTQGEEKCQQLMKFSSPQLSFQSFHEYEVLRNNILTALHEQLKIQPQSDPIISAEGLVRLSYEELALFRDLLLQYVDRIQAVAYVREPKTWIESAFQQRVKRNQTSFDFSKLYPGYQFRFEKFDQVFGRENVSFWLFDSANFQNGCVVRDFCTRLNLAIPEAKILRTNEGLSRDAAALIYAYRKFCRAHRKPHGSLQKSVFKKFQTLKGAKIKLSRDLIDPILQQHIDDIHWMENRMGCLFQRGLNSDLHCITSETDFLNFSDESLRWLASQLEIDNEILMKSRDVDTIGSYVYQLIPQGSYSSEKQQQAILNRLKSEIRP